MIKSRTQLLGDCKLIRETLCDTSKLDVEMRQQQDELAVVAELMSAHVKKNATAPQSQTDYAAETERIQKHYNDALKRYNNIEIEKTKRFAGARRFYHSAL